MSHSTVRSVSSRSHTSPFWATTWIRQDPEKTDAITKMKSPTSVPELRRFLGMANQLGKFSSNLAELTKPLRELLSKESTWVWNDAKEQAFSKVKEELTKPTVLSLYNPLAPTKIAADASSYRLGAVLLQKNDNNWETVSYASRSMSETECRYAQIEKEALATTWACEKFVLGMHFTIETDHKPLVPLLGEKNLDNLPPRILRFRLRLARFDCISQGSSCIQQMPCQELPLRTAVNQSSRMVRMLY